MLNRTPCSERHMCRVLLERWMRSHQWQVPRISRLTMRGLSRRYSGAKAGGVGNGKGVHLSEVARSSFAKTI